MLSPPLSPFIDIHVNGPLIRKLSDSTGSSSNSSLNSNVRGEVLHLSGHATTGAGSHAGSSVGPSEGSTEGSSEILSAATNVTSRTGSSTINSASDAIVNANSSASAQAEAEAVHNSPSPTSRGENVNLVSPTDFSADSCQLEQPSRQSDEPVERLEQLEPKSNLSSAEFFAPVSSASSVSQLEYTTDDDQSSASSAESQDYGSRKRSAGGSSPKQRSMTTCWDSLVSNPAKYLRRERSFLELYPMRRHSWASPGVYDTGSDSNSGSGGRGSGLRRRRGLLSSTAAARARRFGSFADDGQPNPFRRRAASAIADRNSSDISDTEMDLSTGSRAKSSSPGAEGSKKRTAGASPSRVHDMSLHQIADYSPPISSLPPGKSLRAEWKGAPMDLSNDPDVQLLHPAEIHLASVLRLPAEVYLDSKRRLFAEKVHRLRQGLPFRRTDSQKACRIDVNKASRLFGAFEKVGWLEDELFEQYLS